MKSIIVFMSLIVGYAAFGAQVCKEVVSCQEVKAKYSNMTKEERQCFCPARKREIVIKEVPKVVEKVVVKKVVIDRKVIVERTVRVGAPKNIVSVLGGRTVTGLTVHQASPTLFKANTYGQFDAGLMYQRRLSQRWTASVIGTANGSFYGGIGYGF